MANLFEQLESLRPPDMSQTEFAGKLGFKQGTYQNFRHIDNVTGWQRIALALMRKIGVKRAMKIIERYNQP